MRKTATVLIAGALAIGGSAFAEPGDSFAASSADGVVTVLARAGRGCAGKGVVCAQPGAASTVAVPAAEAAARRPPPPAFKRAATVAAQGKRTAGPTDVWSLELEARLARAAIAGNAVFTFYDLADPRAVENREVTAMEQATVPAAKTLVVRARLSPEDGFRAGHTYRMHLLQILGGHEVVLARGDFKLE